ncbi:uncharacterized protein EI90DRAFT_3027975 [Cantharellus anzutake]|uniref:uncharacterized protein n=1 Tax=Cantharellus anzutake TaxID=1750568 RepID=UPI0019073A6F|nr:uncharacterized protein EI90DRAFT_3027975 [Cantharellus anzutake]KAF8344027.1 hypothetical protein EI90DRAFT_3027975 [Cantharellus anzutake]
MGNNRGAFGGFQCDQADSFLLLEPPPSLFLGIKFLVSNINGKEDQYSNDIACNKGCRASQQFSSRVEKPSHNLQCGRNHGLYYNETRLEHVQDAMNKAKKDIQQGGEKILSAGSDGNHMCNTSLEKENLRMPPSRQLYRRKDSTLLEPTARW